MKRIDKVLESIYVRLSVRFKVAFISAIVIGLCAHLYMFTNKLPNYDDMVLNSFGATFRLGRWFLWVLGATAYHLDLVYSLPMVNGLITLLILAIAAGMIADMLQLKSKIANVLVGGLLVVFPSWTGTFFFMFTAPYYAIAVLLSVLAVYCSIHLKKGCWMSGVLIALSLGIYQAYLPFAATLYVVLLILMIYEEMDCGFIIKRAFQYFATLLGGVILYGIITGISLKVTGQSLTSYKGINEMGRFSFSGMIQMLKNMICNGLGVFVNNNLEISYNLLLKMGYLLLMIISILVIAIYIRKLLKNKDMLRVAALAILLIAFFLAVNSVYIMCPDEEAVYSLQTYSYVFLIIFPICLIDRMFSWNGKNITKLYVFIEYCVLLCAGIMAGNYCHYANAQYLAMDLCYEQATSYYTTVITQIKSLEGYSDELPIVFVGGRVEDKTLYRNDVMSVFYMSGRDETLVETYSRQYLLENYCGFAPQYADIASLPQNVIEDMPIYPNEDSIQIVNDVVVIKFSEEMK